jgi:hypothetical protein
LPLTAGRQLPSINNETSVYMGDSVLPGTSS